MSSEIGTLPSSENYHIPSAYPPLPSRRPSPAAPPSPGWARAIVTHPSRFVTRQLSPPRSPTPSTPSHRFLGKISSPNRPAFFRAPFQHSPLSSRPCPVIWRPLMQHDWHAHTAVSPISMTVRSLAAEPMTPQNEKPGLAGH